LTQGIWRKWNGGFKNGTLAQKKEHFISQTSQ
jgi:hypothetical protein